MLGAEQTNRQWSVCLCSAVEGRVAFWFDWGLKVMKKYLNAPAQLWANHPSTAVSWRSRQHSQITVVTVCCLPLCGDRALPTQPVIPCRKVWSKLTAWKKINKDFHFLPCNEKLHSTLSSLHLSLIQFQIFPCCNLPQWTKTFHLGFFTVQTTETYLK